MPWSLGVAKTPPTLVCRIQFQFLNAPYPQYTYRFPKTHTGILLYPKTYTERFSHQNKVAPTPFPFSYFGIPHFQKKFPMATMPFTG